MIDVQTEQLINLAKAAEILAMSQQSVKGYMRRGELEGFKAGSQWRTSVEAIQRFLKPAERLRVEGPTEAKQRRADAKEHERAMAELRARGIV